MKSANFGKIKTKDRNFTATFDVAPYMHVVQYDMILFLKALFTRIHKGILYFEAMPFLCDFS